MLAAMVAPCNGRVSDAVYPLLGQSFIPLAVERLGPINSATCDEPTVRCSISPASLPTPSNRSARRGDVFRVASAVLHLAFIGCPTVEIREPSRKVGVPIFQARNDRRVEIGVLQ